MMGSDKLCEHMRLRDDCGECDQASAVLQGGQNEIAEQLRKAKIRHDAEKNATLDNLKLAHELEWSERNFWQVRARYLDAQLSRLRERVEKMGKVVEAARKLRGGIYCEQSTQFVTITGDHYSFTVEEFDAALLALKDAEGEKEKL